MCHPANWRGATPALPCPCPNPDPARLTLPSNRRSQPMSRHAVFRSAAVGCRCRHRQSQPLNQNMGPIGLAMMVPSASITLWYQTRVQGASNVLLKTKGHSGPRCVYVRSLGKASGWSKLPVQNWRNSSSQPTADCMGATFNVARRVWRSTPRVTSPAFSGAFRCLDKQAG